jgi:hypothetical protein
VIGFITTCATVPITTKVVSSNPAHGVVYSMQHCVIKLVSELRQVGSFLGVFQFPASIKLTTTIYLKYVESGIKHHNPFDSLICYIFKYFGHASLAAYVCCDLHLPM